MKRLWPSDNQAIPAEEVCPDKGDGVTRITSITEPSFTVYPATGKKNTPAVIVYPGGGYNILAINKEGTEVATWLNGLGITVVVVKYRVPKNRTGALQDAQRAVCLVRHHAKEWDIDPTHIGVLGFSAGGHLAARLGTDFLSRNYDKVDVADDESCRPDFCVLVYPAYLGRAQTGQVADDLPISVEVPPTFIVQTKDDEGFIIGTVAYGKALKAAGVPCALHVFEEGGHGYGLRPSKHEVSNWPSLCEAWFRENGILD